MTIKQVKEMLEEITGFEDKVAYHSFPVGEAPALPFICFLETNSNNFSADGIAYSKIHHIQVELYSQYRDIASEELIESKLTDNTIFYQKTLLYLDDEKCYETIYEMEV